MTTDLQDTKVHLAIGYISLSGSNFSPTGVAPTATVGGTSRTVHSFTNTAMVVEVPSTLAAGTYLVTVSNSVPYSSSAYVTVGPSAYTVTDNSGNPVSLPSTPSPALEVKGISLPAGNYVMNAVVQINNSTGTPAAASCQILIGDFPSGRAPGIASFAVVQNNDLSPVMLPLGAAFTLTSADNVGVYCNSFQGVASWNRVFISAIAVQNLTQYFYF
jgi:hypothetical protein